MYPDFLNKKVTRRKQSGYTLLEVVISVMFFAIISIGLALPYCNSIALTANNRSINEANNLARSYLKDIESEWGIQSNFDQGTLIEIDDSYTSNGLYSVTVVSDNVATDDNGTVLVRRINIIYSDQKEHVLANIYYDYSRPGSV